MSTDPSIISERVRFRPRARLLETIGGNLIKDEMAGVVELVKNAHDADASVVRVAFSSVSGSPTPNAIVIEDNGHGMDRDVLVSGWMSPATDWKARVGRSEVRGRPMLGRKGVGRFSAMRLGRQLKIETRPAGDSVIHRIELDWDTITAGEGYLDDVELVLETHPLDGETWTGTRLEISGLRDRWDAGRLGRLLREMRVLLSPVKGREDDPFQIILDLEASGLARSDIQHIGGEVTPFDAPESADYLIIAAVEPNGSCEIVYERRLMADRDRTDLEVVLNIPDVRTAFPEDERNEEITLPLPSGPLHFELRVWDRDAEVLQHKLETDVRYEGLKVRGLRSLLKDAAGVALYRDGFRVRPYGDPGYDWLGLGTRRVDNPTARLGTDQVYGLIDISILENPGLEDKSSREGLEENLAYLTLRQSVLAVLGRVEPLRYQFRKRNNLGRPATRSTDSLATERRDAFTQLRAQIDRVVPEGSTRKVVSSLLLKAEAASEAEHERLAEQAAVMHDMHALGILARFVLHEGRNMQSAFHSALRNMERAVERAIPDPKELRIAPTQRPAFESGLRSSRDVQKRFEHLLNDLDPLTRVRRGKRGTVDLKEVLNRVMSILGPSMQNAGVECIATGVEGTVRAWEQDVMYALYNLLDNALYWVQQNEGKKRITVSVHPAPEPTDAGDPPRVWIDVEDSGPGVPERSADSVFDLNYSEKPDGLGMGLFIASESAGRSHGRLELINPGEPGAIFRLSLEGVKSNA